MTDIHDVKLHPPHKGGPGCFDHVARRLGHTPLPGLEGVKQWYVTVNGRTCTVRCLGVRFGCCSRPHNPAAGSTITVSMLSQYAIGGPVERVAEDDCEFYQGSVRKADSR